MSSPLFIERKQELLATAITTVFAYYSLRVSFVLPKFREMFEGLGDDDIFPTLPRLVFSHPWMITLLVLVLTGTTLWAVWSRHRFAGVIAAAGIVILGIGTQVLCSAAMSPLFRMIQAMGGS